MWPTKPQEHTVGSAVVVKQGGGEHNEKSPEAVLRLSPFIQELSEDRSQYHLGTESVLRHSVTLRVLAGFFFF